MVMANGIRHMYST